MSEMYQTHVLFHVLIPKKYKKLYKKLYNKPSCSTDEEKT